MLQFYLPYLVIKCNEFQCWQQISQSLCDVPLIERACPIANVQIKRYCSSHLWRYCLACMERTANSSEPLLPNMGLPSFAHNAPEYVREWIEQFNVDFYALHKDHEALQVLPWCLLFTESLANYISCYVPQVLFCDSHNQGYSKIQEHDSHGSYKKNRQNTTNWQKWAMDDSRNSCDSRQSRNILYGLHMPSKPQAPLTFTYLSNQENGAPTSKAFMISWLLAATGACKRSWDKAGTIRCTIAACSADRPAMARSGIMAAVVSSWEGCGWRCSFLRWLATSATGSEAMSTPPGHSIYKHTYFFSANLSRLVLFLYNLYRSMVLFVNIMIVVARFTFNSVLLGCMIFIQDEMYLEQSSVTVNNSKSDSIVWLTMTTAQEIVEGHCVLR